LGCEDDRVSACVCEYDPYCCDTAWDEVCAQEVEFLRCGTCRAPFGGLGGSFSVTTVSGVTVGTAVSSLGGAGGSTAGGVGGAGTEGSSTTLGEGGSGGVGQCVEQSETQCEACLCTDCFAAYGDCIGDFGCPVIIACLDESGCTGSDCLLACGDVIDQFGGLEGSSVAYTVALINCATDAGCPCE
jgi:hypothetical protein